MEEHTKYILDTCGELVLFQIDSWILGRILDSLNASIHPSRR